MKLGGRILKTGAAIMLAMYVSMYFQLDPLIFAGMAAVLSVQPSLYRSWQHFLDQLQANAIGAVLAITFTYLFGPEPFVVALVVMIVIAVNLKLGFEKSIPLAIITVIAIMESATGQFLHFAVERFLMILIGITSSFIVNIAFIPPRYEEKLYAAIQDVSRDLSLYLRSGVLNELADKQHRHDVDNLQDEMKHIDQLYMFYQEERTYFRRVRYSKIRKLVLFRKMIQVLNVSLSLIKSVYKHRAELHNTPAQLNGMLQRELELLTSYHERILLKYEGKLKTQHPHHIDEEIFRGRDALLKKFMELYEQNRSENEEEWLHLFPLFSLLIDYADELERLDKMVEGYYSFHTGESK